MVESNPITAQTTKAENNKPKPEARKGNMALEVERPLFSEGNNWDFQALKKDLLAKEGVDKVTEVPKLSFLDGLEAGTD